MNVWMLRIDFENLSLDTAIANSEIYIGWCADDAASLIAGGDYSWERISQSLNTIDWFQGQSTYYKGKAIASVMKFLTFERGDCVVIPKSGEYAVAEVLDDLPYLSTKTSTFARKVRFLANKDNKLTTSRTVTYAKLTTTMGYKGTLCWIGDEIHKREIDELLQKGVKDISVQLREKATDAFLGHMRGPFSNMDANKLEFFIQRLLLKMGAQSAEVVARRNDIGADVIGVFPLLGIRIGVQCKYHVYGQTDQYAVEQIINALKNDEADFGWVVSLAADFPESAKLLAKDNGIRLINGKDLASLVLDIGLLNFEND